MKNDKKCVEHSLVGALVTLGDGEVRAKVTAFNRDTGYATVTLCSPIDSDADRVHLPAGYVESIAIAMLRYLH